MLFVVVMKWKAEDVPKVVEARRKYPVPPEVKTLAEVSIFGQHKAVMVYDVSDVKTVFKVVKPYLQFTDTNILPGVTPEDSIAIVTGE